MTLNFLRKILRHSGTLAACSSFYFVACSPAITKPKTGAREKLNTDSTFNTDDIKSSSDDVSSRKESISLGELNSSAMRLNMLGVAEFSYGRHRFPQVSFSFPDQADYIQVLRCRSETNLGDLGNIEIGASDTRRADDRYLKKDYWKDISSNMFCAYITTGISKDKIIDFYANDGDYVYVARACVEKRRLNTSDPDELASPCSRHIGKTEILRGVKNLEKSLSFESKQKLREQRDKVDAMGREIVYLAKDTDNQISECESKRGKTRASQYRRQALGKIIGTGINLGAKLLTDGLGKSLLSGLGGIFDGVFNDLSAKADDFLPPDFCPAADLNLERMKLLKGQIEVESADYNERMKMYGEQ